MVLLVVVCFKYYRKKFSRQHNWWNILKLCLKDVALFSLLEMLIKESYGSCPYSLSMIPLRSIHVENGSISFFLS